MALFTLDLKPVRAVPHIKNFEAAVKQLGPKRTEEVRAALNDLITNLPPDKDGIRRFSSSVLGSELSPWQHPIAHVYDASRELVGDLADEDYVQRTGARRSPLRTVPLGEHDGS